MNDEKHPAEFPVIETEQLKLRKVLATDVDAIFEYASNSDVTEFVIWYAHKTQNDSKAFIEFADVEFESRSSIIWGIELKRMNKIIGTIDLRNYSSIHRCGEIGYVIGKDHWNKGYVTEAMKGVIDYGFSELSLNRIEAHCEDENIGSWHVMEKSGMKLEGSLREKVFMKDRFRTMKMYSILRNEWARK